MRGFIEQRRNWQIAKTNSSAQNELFGVAEAVGGLRLMVPKSSVGQSKEILEASISDEELARQEDASHSVDGDHAEEEDGWAHFWADGAGGGA